MTHTDLVVVRIDEDKSGVRYSKILAVLYTIDISGRIGCRTAQRGHEPNDVCSWKIGSGPC